MSTDIVTLDPDELARFIAELKAAGFAEADGSGRLFEGPLTPALEPFTQARRMSIVIHDSWPYVQPSVIVEGVDWWHAAHQIPCLWQADDNTKRWVTFEGIEARIDEWALLAARGFDSVQGAALDPQLYFDSYASEPLGIDEALLIKGIEQDGQHHAIHIDEGQDGMWSIAPGKSAANVLSGRWFYRAGSRTPPKSVAEFESALTEKQRHLYDKKLATDGHGLFVLIWPTPHGLASLILLVTDADGARTALAATPTPISQADRLRRAGPDSALLRTKRIVIFGLGAIGSHVGLLLARSGAGFLRVIDGDVMTPAILIRHAATRINTAKVHAFVELIKPFEWTTVDPIARSTRHPTELAELIADCDLCVDATGNSLFAELLSRVALNSGVPMVSVALFRGGSIARVRRQTINDHPIIGRVDHWKYPFIPASDNAEDDYVGTETGCTAPIHNAPPTSVMAAASLAAAVAIDLLSERYHHPDEEIEVLSPIQAPFTQLGRFTPEPPTILITDDARARMTAAASLGRPNETGGILIGLTDPTGTPVVVHSVELPPEVPASTRYTVPAGLTSEAVDKARRRDHRLGYLGEWHSHPTDQPASGTDKDAMRQLAATSDTPNPLLIVLRPTGSTFDLDAYITIGQQLRPTRTLGVGPMEASQTS